jgi:aminoglycoside phosphotransferase (APT) family kinase protein
MISSLPAPFARGRTAEIYRVAPGRVLKLYLAGYPDSNARREFEVNRILQSAGVPTPHARGLERVGERTGVVFDEVTGPPMLDVLARKPWTWAQHARKFAALHAAVHKRADQKEVSARAQPGQALGNTPAGTSVEQGGSGDTPLLPGTRDRLAARIQAADAGAPLREAALRLLDTLPDGNSLCHGDFHPANVILSPAGAVIIDWPGVTVGNPLADVARTLLLMRFGPLSEPSPGRRFLFRTFSRVFAASYLGQYSRLAPADRHELRRWEAVSAVARIADNIAGEREALLAFARRALYLYAPLQEGTDHGKSA